MVIRTNVEQAELHTCTYKAAQSAAHHGRVLIGLEVAQPGTATKTGTDCASGHIDVRSHWTRLAGAG